MDGWAVNLQGGRSDGAFPGDGEPETVNGGRSRTCHMDGWAGIFCSSSRCSAEAKQLGAMQRPGLASRPQQGTVLQDSLKQIKTNIQLMMKRTNIKINSPEMRFSKGMIEMKHNKTVKEAECRCHEEGRPGGGRQGEAGQVDDRAQTQGLDYVYNTSPCCRFTMSSIYRVMSSPCHQFTIVVHAIH